ncbi:MAG: ABC transporter ATP-binding protein [Marivivens sp.]|nr:ABC transporter ATP-binding protein [Marivivens sp.]
MRRKSLVDLTFNLMSGDKLGVIGANGAGKTTLLKLICDIMLPDEGTIFRSGRVSNLVDPSFGLEAEQSGWQNILNVLIYRGYSFVKAKEVASSIAGETGLYEKIYDPVFTFSEGMKLRLAFCISTFEPLEILVFDELIGGGDEKFRQYARLRMDELLLSDRVVVIASHDEALIRKICNKAIYLKAGKMKAFGDVDMCYEEYRRYQ